jgi:excisionase family DNA binding protein
MMRTTRKASSRSTMPTCQNTRTCGVGAQSVKSNITREPAGRAVEVNRLSTAGHSVSEVTQPVLGPGGASATVGVKRRTRNVWLSPRQFARQFGAGTSAVYGAVDRGEVPIIRVGRHIRLPPDTVETILITIPESD